MNGKYFFHLLIKLINQSQQSLVKNILKNGNFYSSTRDTVIKNNLFVQRKRERISPVNRILKLSDIKEK